MLTPYIPPGSPLVDVHSLFGGSECLRHLEELVLRVGQLRLQ